MLYETEKLEKALEITREQLIAMSLFLGFDHCKGVKNRGLVKVFKIVKESSIEFWNWKKSLRRNQQNLLQHKEKGNHKSQQKQGKDWKEAAS